MKVLIFTHRSDIDGMGGAVLAKLAFSKVDYVLCETFNLQDEISKFYDNGSIYEYDQIFITDLWLSEPMLSKVGNDEKLNNKIFVFDHHESAKKEVNDNYSFATLRISDNKGLCSGTSLFYEYLISENLIDINNIPIKEFTELTRRYDTWEWKKIYKDEKAHELSLLFDSVGCEGYIKLMYEKLNSNAYSNFEFSELENMLIETKKNQVNEKISNYAKKVIYRDVMGLKAGIAFIDYEYRNDLAEYFKENGYDIDFAMLIALDKGSISYRSVKDDINVRLVAEAFGGNGHDKSSSSPISEEQKESFIKILTIGDNK